jgi:hypothetical protein
MDFSQQTSIVNLNKVKYMMMNRLSIILTDKNAIIFGGFVRDRLIHDYFAIKFLQKSSNDRDKFDDETYDPETKGRLLVSKDIDLFLEGDESSVEELYNVLRQEGFHVTTSRVRKQYFENINVKQQKVCVRILNAHEMGLTNIEIELDVLFSTEDGIRPPFGRLDLECNAFLMTNKGISLSNQTGTYLDRICSFQHKRNEFEILEKMVKFEADVAILDKDGGDIEKHAIRNRIIRFNRIILMQERGWKINNRVYTVVDAPKNEICDICYSTFSSGLTIKLECCGLYLHKECFANYVKEAYQTKVLPECCNLKCESWEWEWEWEF